VLPHADPVHTVSIVARGRALGWTLSLPVDERYTHTRSELRDLIAVMMGGRTAEELIFEDITTGAANDIERATSIARAMVTEYGMSDLLGPIKLGQQQGEVFLGREFGHQANYSNEVAARIDAEMRVIVDGAHEEARAILTLHRPVLDKLAATLIEKETLDTPELMEILGDLPPWPGHAAHSNGTGHAPTRRSRATKAGQRAAAPTSARRRRARSTRPASRRPCGRSSRPSAKILTATVSSAPRSGWRPCTPSCSRGCERIPVRCSTSPSRPITTRW
jgi:cell division protease FtsH